MKNSIGELIKDEEGTILEVYRAFYKESYTKYKGGSDGLDWLLANSCSDGIQVSSKYECEGSGVVTFETDKMKHVHVLSQMSVNQSPGPDGLPVEFYKTFFEDLIGHIIKVFEYIRDNNLVPVSITEAVTVLIQKDGDKTDPSNPISLLNADYKWLMKYINEFFVQPRLGSIITKDQLCAIKGRSIHDGLCSFRDLIEYSQTADCDTYIVSLDQRKAFDLVSHDILFSAMEHFKLPKAVFSLVRTLYRDVTTRISVNWQLSGELQIERGVRQDCPLSASLYVIYLQLLSYILDRNDVVKGIKVPGE